MSRGQPLVLLECASSICLEYHKFYRSILISDFVRILLFQGADIYSMEQDLNSSLQPPIMLSITQVVMSFYKGWYLRSKGPRVAAVPLASPFHTTTDMNRASGFSCVYRSWSNKLTSMGRGFGSCCPVPSYRDSRYGIITDDPYKDHRPPPLLRFPCSLFPYAHTGYQCTFLPLDC